MNKIFDYFKITAAFVLLAVLSTSCTFNELNISSIDGVTVTKLESNQADILVQVTVDNKNSSKVYLKKAELDILINEKYIGNAKLLRKVVIPSSVENQIEIPLTIHSDQPLAMVATKLGLSSIFKSSKVRVIGEVKGSMNWLPHKVKVDESQELSLDKLKELIK